MRRFKAWHGITVGSVLLVVLLIVLAVSCPSGAHSLAAWIWLSAVLAGAAGVPLVRLVRALEDRIMWLEGTLDAVPQPITVTDLNMRWVFVNKVTEGLLKRDRASLRGHHCSEWGAQICNTDQCGVACLRQGRSRTTYLQNMPDGTQRAMDVDTSYIADRDGRRIGHVEIVSDVHSRYQLGTVHSNLATAIQQISASITEIDSQTRLNASSAGEASRLADASRETISAGTTVMRRLAEAMKAMQESSTKILRVNKVIDEIAFQTNILALNAAVEAARAGEFGSGFAVVADEVRNLAIRCSEAAKETNDLVESSVASVKQGGSLADNLSSSLAAIDSSASHIDELLKQIAAASAQQSEGISSIHSGVLSLHQQTLTEPAA